MMPSLLLFAGLFTAELGAHEVRLSPYVTQTAVLFLSDDVSAGGLGGGVGLQLSYRELYLAQLDVAALWGLSNAAATRWAVGMQRSGWWAPAGWLTCGALWGERVEFLTADGRRPPVPTWSVGVRAAPLRFAGERGVVTLLEPGIATDFQGGMWLELTVMQVGLSL